MKISSKNACVAIVTSALVLAGCGSGDEHAASVREDARPGFGGDFTLTDHDGRRFQLPDVQGRPAVLFFGYTSCPDMCPMTMSRIAGALSRIGGPASEVVTLFVSVDPRRDTPAVLKSYVSSFTTPIIGLTGTDEEIRRVASAYHASHEVVHTGTPNYLVNHTSAIFMIDRRGTLRQYFKYDEEPDVLAAALRTLLDEKP